MELIDVILTKENLNKAYKKVDQIKVQVELTELQLKNFANTLETIRMKKLSL